MVLWGQLAEFASDNLVKGSPAYVEGRLQSRTWQTADGTNRRTVEIVADTLRGRSATRTSDIRHVAERQADEFSTRDLNFQDLWVVRFN